MTDRPAYSFSPGPPPDAMAFLKNKGLKPAFSWADVEPEEHAVAFTVAKAMQADVLQDIRSAVEQALAEGRTFAQFQKELKPSLVKKGWWGEQTMVDPLTGKSRTVQLGSPRRLKTIYQSNLRSARAAGQWQRIQRTKAVRPYLVYNLGPSERHRAAHVAKRGLVLPVDDPFWLTWYPPNGWGCLCWVRQINRREAEQIGIREAPLVETRPWKNWRTGEIHQVPMGIDPGWQSNPGAFRLRRMEELLTEKLHAADPAVAQVVARDVASSWRVRRLFDGVAPGAAPIAVLPTGLRGILDTTTDVVMFRDRHVEKLKKHPEVTASSIAIVGDLIERGAAYLDETRGRPALVLHSPDSEPKPWWLVLDADLEFGGLSVATLHRQNWRKIRKRITELKRLN